MHVSTYTERDTCVYTQTHRERKRYTHTHKDADRQTDTHTHTHTNTERDIYSDTHKDTDTHIPETLKSEGASPLNLEYISGSHSPQLLIKLLFSAMHCTQFLSELPELKQF